MIHLDIKLIYKAPGAEDKSRPISSNAEVVATVMPLSWQTECKQSREHNRG